MKKDRKHSSDGLSDVEKQSAFSRAMHSIRTRYSLVTAAFLMAALVSFYIGGRIVLVHLIRDAEQQVKEVGHDISRIAYLCAERVSRDAQNFMRKGPPPADRSIADVLGDARNFTLAARFDSSGGFIDGAICTRGMQRLGVEDFRPYSEVLTNWCSLRGSFPSRSAGIMHIREMSHYVALVMDDKGSVLLLGRVFDSDAFAGRRAMGTNIVARSSGGMSVTVNNRTAAIVLHETPSVRLNGRYASGGFGIAPMIDEAIDFYSGGFWDFGTNPFEAQFTIRDVAGNAVSVVTVSIPKTFADITRSAIGRLAFFIAMGGILFVLPIFWFQSRVLLNPLTKMTKAIAELGKHNADIDCPRLDWKGKDEFALLALSVNRMLETISARSISVAQTEARHRALIDGLPDALTIFDPIGRLVAISKEPEGLDPLPGFVPGELPLAKVFGEKPVEQFLMVLGEVFRSGKPGIVRLKALPSSGAMQDGVPRHFEVRMTRMDDYFSMAIIRDVTAEVIEHKRRIAAEERASDSKKRESLTLLAAGIAHDMNNVLSVVLSAAEAKGADPSGDSAGILGTIRDAVHRGSSMMKELMAFAGENKIALERMGPDRALADMKNLVERVVPANVIVTCEADADAPEVDIDPNQFWKVIFNIVKNAGEAIGARPGHITVCATRFEMSREKALEFKSEKPLAEGPGTLFTITDDGPGIRSDLLPKLFDPFVSSKAVGRGLGLATVRTIVEAHGGGIAVLSRLDYGTEFRIYLPESKLQKKEKEKTTVIPAGGLSGEVLIVDDEEAILRTTSILLKGLGFTAHRAKDGTEALGIVRRCAGNLKAIILDADLGGVDTVRLLSSFRTSAPEVPVLVSTGSAEESIRRLFATMPYDGFLSKPYTLMELRTALGGLRRNVV